MKPLFILVNNWEQDEEFILFTFGLEYRGNRAFTFYFGLVGISFRLTLFF